MILKLFLCILGLLIFSINTALFLKMSLPLSLRLDKVIIWDSASFFHQIFDVTLVVFTCEVEKPSLCID